jgi:phage baseplate assembly protein W
LQYNFPFKIDGRGHSAEVNYEGHIQQLIEQLLFTVLGERVNRPTFGTRVNQLVFAPNSDELAASTQFLIQGSLQQWLGELIHVVAVDTKSQDSKLFISVQYLIKKNPQQTHIVQFNKEL